MSMMENLPKRKKANILLNLKNSIKGVEVNVDNINRILVLRNEVDIKEIKKFYNKINEKDFAAEISNIFNGAYKDLILYLYNK